MFRTTITVSALVTLIISLYTVIPAHSTSGASSDGKQQCQPMKQPCKDCPCRKAMANTTTAQGQHSMHANCNMNAAQNCPTMKK
jgi:hypothetical protein